MTDTHDSRRDLWCAVIQQALIDATSQSQGNAEKVERNRARSWLTTPSRDFAEVCSLAGKEPDRIRALALKVIAEADSTGTRPMRQAAPAPKPVKAPVPPLPPMRPARMILGHSKPYRGTPARSFTLNGETHSASEWARRLGISKSALYNRIASGWPLSRALTEPMSERAKAHRTSLKSNRAASA